MLSVLFYLFLISSGSAYCASHYNKRFEETLPITMTFMVLIPFLFGIMGKLLWGFYAVILLAFTLYILTTVSLIKEKNFKEFLKNTFTPGAILFVLSGALLTYFNYRKLASHWDEFTHWVDVVKVMTQLDDFGTNPGSNCPFQCYPPAVAIFEYILQKINMYLEHNQELCEWQIYVSYQLFLWIPVFPFLKNLSFKKPLSFLITSVCFFLCPVLFYEQIFSSVYSDPVLAVYSGLGLAAVILWDRKDWICTAYVCSLCMLLVLSKDAGMLFALFLAIAFMIYNCPSRHDFVSLKTCPSVLIAFLPLIGTFLVKLLWKIELITSHAEIKFTNKIEPIVLWKVLTGQDTTYRSEVMSNFIQRFFHESGIFLGDSQISLTYCSLMLFEFILLYFGIKYRNRYSPELHRKNTSILWIFISQSFVYIFGVFLLYLFKLSPWESVHLASFDRYIRINFTAGWILILAVFLSGAQRAGFKSIIIECLILAAVLFSTPSAPVSEFISKQSVQNSIIIRAPYEYLTDKIRTMVPKSSSVYFISQEDTGFDSWVLRFNVRPRNLSSNLGFSIGKPFYDGDVWTHKISPEEWQKELIAEYDYVAVFRSNDYFVDTFGVLFENPSQIQDETLFAVDKETGMLSLCE